MRNAIQLAVSNPCHENWQQMNRQQQGRFCGSCQKTVIDFSLMSDKQLLDFFKSYPGDVCGRFDDRQLLRPLLAPAPPKPGWMKWAIGSLLTFLTMSNKAKAQTDVMTTGKVAIKKEVKLSVSQKEKLARSNMFQKKLNAIEIKGTVRDENGSGIPYASIQIQEEKWGVSADSLGNYVLKIAVKTDSVGLLYSAIGFEQTEKILSVADAISQKQDTVLVFKPGWDDVIVNGYGNSCTTMTMGMVIRATRIKSEKVADSISGPMKAKIYPNPAKPGSVVSIPFDINGKFGLRLIDANGRVVFTLAPVEIYAGQKHRLVIPANFTSGQYFVQILDNQSKCISTCKLLVVE